MWCSCQRRSGFVLKSFRDTFVSPVDALHVPIEILRPFIAFLGRTVEVAACDNHLLSVSNALRALNAEGKFANFSLFAVTALGGLARVKLKSFQISRTA
jgi:hypothetical protein